MTSRVMLSDAGSNAFGRSEHCFRALRALLSGSQSYAFGRSELCFRLQGACLWTIQSNAPDGTEQWSDEYKGMAD